MPLRLQLHVVSPYQVFVALTLCTSCQTTETSYHVASLMRYEWSPSFHLVVHDRMAGVFHQATHRACQGGALCF